MVAEWQGQVPVEHHPSGNPLRFLALNLFREYCANYGPSVLTEQIESDPAFSRLNITAEQRRMYLDRVFAQGIDSLFEGYMRSTLSSELVSPLRQNNANMPPTPTPTGSIADSGVALGSQHSSMETTSQESLLDQPPNIEDLNYQPTLVDGQVLYKPTRRYKKAQLSHHKVTERTCWI